MIHAKLASLFPCGRLTILEYPTLHVSLPLHTQGIPQNSRGCRCLFTVHCQRLTMQPPLLYTASLRASSGSFVASSSEAHIRLSLLLCRVPPRALLSCGRSCIFPCALSSFRWYLECPGKPRRQSAKPKLLPRSSTQADT